MSFGLMFGLLLLLGFLTLVSYVNRIYAEMGKFLSREYQENLDSFEQDVEPRLGANRTRAEQAMALLTQLSLVATTLLVGYNVITRGPWGWPDVLEASVLLVLIIIVFNQLLPVLFFTRTSGHWLRPFAPLLRIFIYIVFPVTLLLGFSLSVAALTKDHAEEQPESASEAVDAFIDAGEEEGILEKGDRQLIQSVVQFGDKTVRDVMTARPEVVAVPAATTIEQFIELLRKKPISRVPVYEESIDDVVGIIFAHDVLQIRDTEAKTRTVREMMKPARFVPETKRVADLMRELQREHVHLAIVIDEYGSTAGVVTIEDLVEEIVGEIRDEHEAKTDIVQEGTRTFVLPGNTDVDILGQLFGKRPEDIEATTVAGLVSELAGRIPAKGEVIEQEGWRFEVLDSTDRRIERVRVSTLENKDAESRMHA